MAHEEQAGVMLPTKYFCERCGKRLSDADWAHTCSPPMEIRVLDRVRAYLGNEAQAEAIANPEGPNRELVNLLALVDEALAPKALDCPCTHSGETS